VNCAQDTPNYFENDSTLKYHRFLITEWPRVKGMNRPDGVLEFFREVLEWIDEQVAEGHGVLLHCFAGAHVSGSLGVIYVMHATGAHLARALAAVKFNRPIVEPIGHTAELLKLFHGARHLNIFCVDFGTLTSYGKKKAQGKC